MPTHTRTFLRENFYEEVWSDSLAALALRFGMAIETLVKLCTRMGIPRPPPGYWMQLECGRADPRPPLPALKRGEVAEIQWQVVDRTPRDGAKPPLDLPPEALRERDPANRIVVLDALTEPHPTVRRAARDLPKSSLDRGFLDRKQCLDISVTPAIRERALRVADALLKALEGRGWRIEVTDPVPASHDRWNRMVMATASVTRVHLGEVGIRLRIFEDKDRVVIHPPVRPPTPAAPTRRGAPAPAAPIERPRIEYRPNGGLCIQIETETKYNPVRRAWLDRPNAPIEGALNRVVEGLIVMVEGIRKARRDAEERERKRQEDERRRRASAERAAEEQARVADLTRRADAWRQANEMAAFIAEIDHAAHEQGKLFAPGSDHARWLSWAHEHVAAVRHATFRGFPAAPPLKPQSTGQESGNQP